MTNPTACRKAFEKYISGKGHYVTRHRYTNPDGSITDDYQSSLVQFCWEMWQAAWNTREPEGDAVAWMVTRERDPTFPRTYTEKKRAIACVDMVTLPPFAKIVNLYTHPRATSAEDARNAARYRWLRNETDAGRTLDVCNDQFYIIEGRALDQAIDAAMAQRGDLG